MRKAPSYQTGYIQNYDANNTQKTLSGSFLQKGHYLLEKTLPRVAPMDHVVEVGAGSGHHFPYVNKTIQRYTMTDKSEEMLDIARGKFASDIDSDFLCIEKQDATRLSYPNHSFDRLIATHVLEHLPNPVSVLEQWDRVVKPGGIISILLPCDPGMLWRLGRHFGPRRNARKHGLEYDYLQASEHINPIFNLVVFIRHHFEAIRESWYPARVPMPDLNLFYICHIQKN